MASVLKTLQYDIVKTAIEKYRYMVHKHKYIRFFLDTFIKATFKAGMSKMHHQFRGVGFWLLFKGKMPTP